MEKINQVFVLCECDIIFGDRADLILIKEEIDDYENSNSGNH